jgi:hypothetical protein
VESTDGTSKRGGRGYCRQTLNRKVPEKHLGSPEFDSKLHLKANLLVWALDWAAIARSPFRLMMIRQVSISELAQGANAPSLRQFEDEHQG